MNANKPEIGDYCRYYQFIFDKNTLDNCNNCLVKCVNSKSSIKDFLIKKNEKYRSSSK